MKRVNTGQDSFEYRRMRPTDDSNYAVRASIPACINVSGPRQSSGQAKHSALGCPIACMQNETCADYLLVAGQAG